MVPKTTVAGIELEHPVMNAAGPRCKTVDEIRELAHSPVAAIMVGSITVEPRPGNEGEVYYSDPEGAYSLNSLGLPNGGLPYYEEHLPQMVEVAHAAGKPLFVSLAGFNPEDFARLVEFAQKHKVDLAELNLGCPNVWSQEAQKPIISYHLSLVEEVLEAVDQVADGSIPIAAKLSPLPPDILTEIAAVLVEFEMIKVVGASNTLPSAFAWDIQRRGAAITYLTGLAGMAGPALKPTSLGVIKQLHDLLPDRIDLMAAGGIRRGQDVLDYQRIGPKVKAVQLATAHMDHGARVFGEILAQMATIQEVTKA